MLPQARIVRMAGRVRLQIEISADEAEAARDFLEHLYPTAAYPCAGDRLFALARQQHERQRWTRAHEYRNRTPEQLLRRRLHIRRMRAKRKALNPLAR